MCRRTCKGDKTMKVTKFTPPPRRPQDSDKRFFNIGDKVQAYFSFYNSCPPFDYRMKKKMTIFYPPWEKGKKITSSMASKAKRIIKGTEGVVTAYANIDDHFGKIRMISVKWNNGLTSHVVDRLLSVSKKKSLNNA
jgi:hypothetical protein